MEDFEVDRLGISRVVLCQQWATETPRRSDAPTQLLPSALPLVRFRSGQKGGVKFGTAQWFFEGADNDSDLNPDGNDPEFYFGGTFNQETIQSHPYFQFLIQTYGGVENEGDVVWPLELPDSAKGRVGGLRLPKTDSGKPRNPLFGTDSYFALGAIWSLTYATRTIPSDILDDVGTIVSPRGNPPTPKNRNWLKMAPNGRKRGNVVQITESWMMSGIGGWVPDVYSVRYS